MPDPITEIQRLLSGQGLLDTGDFINMSRRPRMSFKTRDVEPPLPQLIDLDDVVLVTLYNVSTQPLISISMRILTPDGGLMFTQDTVTLPVNGFKTTFTKALNEGFLIGVVISTLGFNIERGQVYVRVQVARSGFLPLVPYAQLCADYIISGQDVSWPVGRIVSPLEGPGFIRKLDQANPGAGNEILITQTGATRWRFQSLHFRFTTSAAAGTRFPELIYDTGAGSKPVWQASLLSAGQGPSTIIDYSLAAGTQQFFVGTDNEVTFPLPDPHIMVAGANRVRTATTGIAAGDTYTNVFGTAEEWLNPNQ